MRKFILMMVTMFTVMFANAQVTSTSNYVGSSRFTDNWSITLQGGVVTPFNHVFVDGSTTPIIVLGVDKYVNKWLGFGIDARTSIGVGSKFNPHTVFDAVNVGATGKVNLTNIFTKYTGRRRLFEPVVYAGVGWGHTTCSDNLNHTGSPITWLDGRDGGTEAERNYVTFRVGTEFNFNLGKKRAWALVVNPSVVWGNIRDMRLEKSRGNFELTTGIVYHFKTSNGTHSFTRAKLYDQSEIDKLNATIAALQDSNAELSRRATNAIGVAPTPPVVHHTKFVSDKVVISFKQNSSELTDESKASLDKISDKIKVTVTGSTSPEGTERRNTELAAERAQVVADYLRARGVEVETVTSGEAARAAIVTLVKK